MGTETTYGSYKAAHTLGYYVKLNDPLMGTET